MPRVQLSFFLTLSIRLVVEDDERISKRSRSPRNAESQRVVEFYCCGNHLSQGQMIIQGVNLLVEVSSGEFTRELDKEPLLN